MGKLSLNSLDFNKFSHSTLSLLSVLLVSFVALSGFLWIDGGSEDYSGEILSGFAPVQTASAKFSQEFYSSLIPKAPKKPIYTNINEKEGEPFFREYVDASSSAPAGNSAPVLRGYFLPAQNSLLNKYGVLPEFSQYIKPVYRVKDVSRNKQSADYFYLNVAGKVDKTIIGYVGTDELKKLDTKNQLVELQTPKEQYEKELKEGRTPSKSLGWISKTKDLEIPLEATTKPVSTPKPKPSAKKIIANFVFEQQFYSSLAPITPKNPLYIDLGETKENTFLRNYLDVSTATPSGHTPPTIQGYLIPKDSTYADRYYSIKKEFSKYLQPVYRVVGATGRGGKQTDYFHVNKPGKTDNVLLGFVGTDELKKYDTKNQLVRLVAPSDQLLVRKDIPATLGWIMKSKGSLEAVEDETVPIPPETPVILPIVVPAPIKPEPTKAPAPTLTPAPTKTPSPTVSPSVSPTPASEIAISIGDATVVKQ